MQEDCEDGEDCKAAIQEVQQAKKVQVVEGVTVVMVVLIPSWQRSRERHHLGQVSQNSLEAATHKNLQI